MNKSTVILAHGAGASMDSDWMNAIAEKLARQKLNVIRFEFPYMDKRRQTGKKYPPDKLPVLMQKFNQVINNQQKKVFVAGKSMGGRIASIIAPHNPKVLGVIAYGYPFHPPGKPQKLRTEHLLNNYNKPMLIVQGQNDPFGKMNQWAEFNIDKSIEIFAIPKANHDLKPNKSTGLDLNTALDKAVQKTVAFINKNSG